MDERPILVVEDDAAVRGLIVDCLRPAVGPTARPGPSAMR
jgi:CheY-like chemotaxis protein